MSKPQKQGGKVVVTKVTKYDVARDSIAQLTLAADLCARAGARPHMLGQFWGVSECLRQINSVKQDNFMVDTFEPVLNLALRNHLECAVYNCICADLSTPFEPGREWEKSNRTVHTTADAAAAAFVKQSLL